MSSVSGKVCVVTGAGSGIGRALALELAQRHARLSVSDVDAAGLAETVELVKQRGAEVHQAEVDVSDAGAMEAYAAAVREHYGEVHQVYNNAGIAFSRPTVDSDLRDYQRVLGVNLWGVIHGTKAFLPHLIASGDGHVVNVSSLNGIMAQGELTHYCTAKFAVRGFTEALRMEMLMTGQPVQVSCVHPGGVATAIADNSVKVGEELGYTLSEQDRRRRDLYKKRLLRMPPTRAAQIVVDGVEKGRPRILVGRDAKALDAFVRIAPQAYVKAVAAVSRRFGG